MKSMSMKSILDVCPPIVAACKLENKYKGDGNAIKKMDDFTTTAAATVPEPATQLMLGTGLLALVAGRRRFTR
jgi:hypothetical protein